MANEQHPEFFRNLIEAFVAGGLGRALYYALGAEKPSTLTLWLWQIPAAAGMGLIGFGIAEHLELVFWPEVALIVFVGAAGVKFIDALISRVTGGPPK